MSEQASGIFACSNCVPGDAGPLYWPVTGTVVASVVLGFVIWRFAKATTGLLRALSVVSIASLWLGVPTAAAIAVTPIQGHGWDCSNALAASRERGVPDDSALDIDQLDCKKRGKAFVRTAVTVGTVTEAIGITGGLVVWAGQAMSARAQRRSALQG